MDPWTPVRSSLHLLISFFFPLILWKFSKLEAGFGYITPLITKYTFPFLQSSLRVKNIASGKKLQRLLGNTNGGRPDNGVSVCEGVYSRP